MPYHAMTRHSASREETAHLTSHIAGDDIRQALWCPTFSPRQAAMRCDSCDDRLCTSLHRMGGDKRDPYRPFGMQAMLGRVWRRHEKIMSAWGILASYSTRCLLFTRACQSQFASAVRVAERRHGASEGDRKYPVRRRADYGARPASGSVHWTVPNFGSESVHRTQRVAHVMQKAFVRRSQQKTRWERLSCGMAPGGAEQKSGRLRSKNAALCYNMYIYIYIYSNII